VSPARPVVLSPMRRRHLGDVLAIERRVYPTPWARKLFEDELDRDDRHYVVARVGAELVGYAGLLLVLDEGHVATVAVDPPRQGAGIATRLLLELVTEGVALGARHLTLEVRASNTRAQALYRRFGFVPAGARKGYYGDNGEDAIVMWAHDVAEAEHRRRLDALAASLVPPAVRRGFAPRPGARAPALASDPVPVGAEAGGLDAVAGSPVAAHPAARSAGRAARMDP